MILLAEISPSVRAEGPLDLQRRETGAVELAARPVRKETA